MGEPKTFISKATYDRDVNRLTCQRDGFRRHRDELARKLRDTEAKIASLEAGWRSAKASLDVSKAEHEATKSELQKLIKRVGKDKAKGIARG